MQKMIFQGQESKFLYPRKQQGKKEGKLGILAPLCSIEGFFFCFLIAMALRRYVRWFVMQTLHALPAFSPYDSNLQNILWVTCGLKIGI